MSSRVGSLYYEVLLDADGFEKGAAKLRKQERSITSFIKNQQKEILSERQKAHMEAERLAKENWEVHRHDAEKRAAVSKLIVEDYKRRVRAIEEEERRHQQAMDRIRQQEDDDNFRTKGQETFDKKEVIEKLKKGIKELAGEGGGGGLLERLGDVGDWLSKKIGKVTMALFPLVVAVTAIKRGWQALIGTAMDFVKAYDEKKKSLMVLEQLYGGNKEVVAELRAELVEYAKQTAFSVNDTMELAIQLKALGFQANETVSAIKMFGKLSFGDSSKIKLIAKAYSDVRAQGKLLMTEVRQFANQGVPLLLKLQDQMGMSALEVRDAMKNGLIEFKQVKQALEEIASDFGDSDKMGLKTFTGQMDALAESWGELKAELGENEAMVEIGIFANKLMDGLSDLVKTTKKFNISWVEFILGPLEDSIPVLGKVIWATRKIAENLKTINFYIRSWKNGLWPWDQEKLDQIMENNQAVAKAKMDNAKLEAALHAADMKRMDEKEARLAKEDKAVKTYMRERIKLMREAAGLTGPEDDIVAYREKLQQNGSLSGMDINMLTELKKQTMIAEENRAIDKLSLEMQKHEEKRRERMLSQALPGKMKQNSVEEFLYLKTARANAERERKAEARFHQEMQDKEKKHREQIKAIEGISVSITGSELATH